MPVIRILPPEVVNRIAAGEVVERPASIIKELVENAIDAHATEVEVDLEEGGKKRVAVRDNGCGMSAEDLPLAFASHATSKLAAESLPDGLFGVETLGFRGEALASIAAVADVEVVSRPAGSEHAWRFRPGRGEDAEPAAAPPGTRIEVRDLFARVPARRKFLRATSTELSHAVAQVVRLALGFPSIRFRLTSSGKNVLDFAPAECLAGRIAQVLGPGSARRLIEVEEGEEDEPPFLRGYIGSPELRRKDTREQHFFVNGRWVRDRTLSHALRTAFQGFLVPGWQPIAFLFLECPPDAVDVNVHPTKAEVRFRDAGSVYPLVFHALRRGLAARRDEEARRELEPARDRDGGRIDGASRRGGADPGERGRGSAELETARERTRQATLGFLSSGGGSSAAPGTRPDPSPGRGGRGDASGKRSERGAGAGEAAAPEGPDPFGDPFAASPAGKDRGGERVSGASTRPELPAGPAREAASTERRTVAEKGGPSGSPPGTAPAPLAGRGSAAFQILDSYLVLEEEGGMRLIDQHALHEKILFEEIHRRLLEGEVLRQKLIVPDVCEVPVEAMPLVERARELLDPCGYAIEPFGDREVAIHAVPRLFERVRGGGDGRDVVLEVLGWLREDSGNPAGSPVRGEDGALSAPYRRLASLLACKRAVKAGMRLRTEEIRSLLERADLADDPRYCPHGRPTSVRIDRRELEKKFDRR